jgi:polysaccharide export outer membrane protein
MSRARLHGLLTAVILTSTSLLAGCGGGIYDTYAYGLEYDPRKHEYVIGVSDALQVTVFHTTDIGGSGTVRPDGILTLPLIGDVRVAGKAPSQVREEVKRRFGEYVKADLSVSVVVTSFNSYRFVVTGQVNHPGTVLPKYFVTASEAIAMAGGPTKFASDTITIFRLDPEGKVRQIPISYKRLMGGRYPQMDVAMVTGDTMVME